ncbi:MAG: hypothetical protein F6K09_04290 [Merismopedia sp. SIO2A8]|nr:hypothetical protein [Symploca sp. SIO2B6]NET47944.1 hypothetical protein [Merismopedia sp. SIO2A8]
MNMPLNVSVPSKCNLNPPNTKASLITLSKAWAERYIRTVHHPQSQPAIPTEMESRRAVADILNQGLRTVSVQAWAKTEQLLSEEVVRHQIQPEVIDPWAISGDVYKIYNLAFESYAHGITPERFAVDASPELGKIRAKFTAIDPRVIGFVSMQFHYTGQFLVGLLEPCQQEELKPYFKAIDDHLYMPLQRAYDAAASYPQGSLELNIVQQLLPESSAIAKRVVNQVIQAFPNHQCYSGALNSSIVRSSSTRDAEMFQTYIWVCVLEKNISVVQQELFPLCVMLYPTFKVKWEIVRYMLVLLEREFAATLAPDAFVRCLSYLAPLNAMFSPEVFAQAA